MNYERIRALGLEKKYPSVMADVRYHYHEVSEAIPEALLPTNIVAVYDQHGQILIWPEYSGQKTAYNPEPLLNYMRGKGAVIGQEGHTVVGTWAASGHREWSYSTYKGVSKQTPTRESDALGKNSAVTGWDWFMHIVSLLPMKEI